MASDPTITAAMRAAEKMRCCRGGLCLVDAKQMYPPCGMPFHRPEAAATVAAFLRAIPDLSVCPRGVCKHNGAFDAESLAAAVEAAAHE
jgi:hypothetical protein